MSKNIVFCADGTWLLTLLMQLSEQQDTERGEQSKQSKPPC
jgi:hypothetical protein